MSKFIYKQDAIDAVEKESQVDGAYGYMDTKSIIDLLCDLPFAESEIIRCKDCKYYYNTNPEIIPTANIICFQMHEDDYCSYAERRADE